MIPGAEMMAQPKKGKAKPLKKDDDRLAIIHLKGTRAYAEWLEEFHTDTHIPKATLVRLALADLAKKHGRNPPPEF